MDAMDIALNVASTAMVGALETNEVEETATTAKSEDAHVEQEYYCINEEELKTLKSESPWMKDPKHFKSVALSPSAVMKISMHCQSGVDKGIAKGGNPIEVMGLLVGRPGLGGRLVVTDAFPLPVEGFETRVVADDENVTNHMIALSEFLEKTRKEIFMGWYHSHPFDLTDPSDTTSSHCYLSQTDLTTQLQWQRTEDPHGNPFVAIVVDPLRSTQRNSPELKAFRVYPPEYNSPVPNECPDGSVEATEQLRLERWGNCYNRYYQLKVEYFMSDTSRYVLDTLTQDYLWIRSLVSASPTKLTGRLATTAEAFQKANASNDEWTAAVETLGSLIADQKEQAAVDEAKKVIFS